MAASSLENFDTTGGLHVTGIEDDLFEVPKTLSIYAHLEA